MKKSALVLLAVILVAGTLPAAGASRTQSNVDPPVISWQPPATHSPAPAGGRTALAEIGFGPAPFYPVTPCRQYDSRSTTPLAHNTPHTVVLNGAPCGIPSATNAIAVNITIFNISGATGNGVFWVDSTSPPTVAWINYPPTEAQRGNAGVVVVSAGHLVVQVNQGAGSVDFVVDVFGYYYNASSALGLLPTGHYFSIRGDFSGGGVLYGRNYEASGAYSHGVRGLTNSTGTGSAGVEGEATATSGTVYGVQGLVTASTSPDSAGVMGFDGSGRSVGFSGTPAGVRGESHDFVGVLGLSNSDGVMGETFDNLGVWRSSGILGTGSYGVWAVGNMGATGTKPFVEPHPTDASKVIRFVALEGPEAGTYFRGSSQIENGAAVIEVPDHFRWVTDDTGLTVHLTPVGGPGQLWVESQGLDRIVVRSTRDVAFHFLVHGVRKAYKDWQVVADGNEYMPRSAKETLPACLSEEAKSRLIRNGTYNPDGTVNEGTAERLGWTKVWAERTRPKEVRNSEAPQQ